MSIWTERFGKDYTDRNNGTVADLNALFMRSYGISRAQLNSLFLADIDRNSRILEVGCNVGNQIACLMEMGFLDIHGIEIQEYAASIARSRLGSDRVTVASALDIPFRSGSFDLVFTSGVLIHIPPHDLQKAMAEICRVARHFVWGMEYYSSQSIEIEYRGTTGTMWKDDFAKRYVDLFPALTLLKEIRVKYLSNDNQDAMFLLTKNQR